MTCNVAWPVSYSFTGVLLGINVQLKWHGTALHAVVADDLIVS